MSAIAVTRPLAPSAWPRMLRSGSAHLAVLVDRVRFGSHRAPPPDCDDHVSDDPETQMETQMMIALICAMQV
jgi:hypothetical protein